jgi:hypothetical protein
LIQLFFAQNYEFLYDALEKNAQLVEKNKFDQSIKATSMRKILNQAAMSRNGNYKGGMKDYVKNMGEIGKATKYLKRAGYLSLAVDVVDSSIKVYKAESSDRV